MGAGVPPGSTVQPFTYKLRPPKHTNSNCIENLKTCKITKKGQRSSLLSSLSLKAIGNFFFSQRFANLASSGMWVNNVQTQKKKNEQKTCQTWIILCPALSWWGHENVGKKWPREVWDCFYTTKTAKSLLFFLAGSKPQRNNTHIR